ncbi:MAG TPA: N-formylglutamate amidohydrolase [Sphingomicrobium sp.]|nr:N-formylglutamate amidohydrolase [Sphingomicrobium sp.]
MPAPIVEPGHDRWPVLLSVPHAGRDYPDWLTDMARGGRKSLEALEDPLVDRLVTQSFAAGIAAVIALAPRAAIDCNRAEDEIDPAVVRTAMLSRPTARARGGLGVVPSRTAGQGQLWRQPIGLADLEARLAQAHRPYHRAIRDTLERIRHAFGCALLLDCHSMPPPADGVPPIVLGDRFGRTSARWLTADALAIVRQAGFDVALNDPFAGGHVIDRHGNPRRGIHALQIEIDRRCYLDADGRPGGGFDRIAALIQQLATGLAERMLDRQLPTAAE